MADQEFLNPTLATGDRPNMKQLLEVMRIKDVNVTTRWRDLGLELVDSYNTLKVIETNHHNDVDTCCRVMFEKWLDTRPTANWNQLITALINIGMNTAADAIRKQLQSEQKKLTLIAQKSSERVEEFDGEVDHAGSGDNDEHFAASAESTLDISSVSFLDCEDISVAFSRLTAKVFKLLEKVNVNTLRRAIVQQRRVPRGVQLPDNLCQSIKAAQDLDTLLDILIESDYWSWVDLRLLETLVVSSGIQEAEILIHKYKQAIFPRKLSDIIERLPLPQQKEDKIAYTTKVGTKILKKPSEVTVGDLSHYCSILEKVIMDINSGSCVLKHLEDGCLEIHWLIPTHCRFHAYKSALNNRHKFCDIHLQYLHIEPYPPIYDLFSIQPTMLTTLLQLSKPIASTPAEVIDHYYCFLADNLDSSIIRQTMHKVKVISEKDIVISTTMCSEYQKNAFLLNHLLIADTASIIAFCHSLEEKDKQLGHMLVTAIKSLPTDDTNAIMNRHLSTTSYQSCISEEADQPETFLAAKAVHLKFLELVAKLSQKLRDYNPQNFLAACDKLSENDNHLEAVSFLASSCAKDFGNVGMKEIFRRLSFLWTWINHSILRAVLEACGWQDCITMLDDFESEIDFNQPIELYPIPPPSIKMAPFLSSYFTILSIRSEQYHDDLPPLYYVNEVSLIMMEKFGISSHALQLLAAQANPLMLYWMILKSIVPLINAGVHEHLDFIKQKRLSEIAIYPSTILFATDNLNHGSFSFLSSQTQNIKDKRSTEIGEFRKENQDEKDKKSTESEELRKENEDIKDKRSTEIEELRKENERMNVEIKELKEELNEKNLDLRISILLEENRRLHEFVNKRELKTSKRVVPMPKPPPKSADNMLLLKDLPKKFKEGNLELYLDGITDLEYKEDEYTYDIKQYEGDTVVLVTFNSKADLDDIINEISKKPFTGHYIKAEKVPACTSVIIKHIPPEKCDEDTLELYFSNKRKSGVNHYKTIKILTNDTAIVNFMNEQDLQIILKKDHEWLGKKVVMYRYDFLASFGEASSPEKMPPVSSQPDALPTPMHVISNELFQKSITKNMAEFCKSQLSSLESSLEEFCASVTIDEGGCIIIDPVSGNESITDWKENCTKLLDDWLLNFDEKEMKIPSVLHDKMFHLIARFQRDLSITITFTETESLLHAIGKSDKIAELVKEVGILRDAELIETEDIALDEKKMIFITQIGYKELSRSHPEIKFTAKDETVLQVEGNKLGREKFLQYLYGLQFFYESLQVSQMLIKFFSSTNAGKAIVQASLQGYESIAATLVTNNCFYIIGADKIVITKLLSIIKSKVGEKQIKAPAWFKNICHDHIWTSLCTEMQDSLSVLTAVSPTEDHVIIAGDFTKVNVAAKRIEQFFSDECYGKERIPLKSGQWKYLSHHAIMEFSKLMSKAENKRVGFQQPKEDDKHPTIVLEGDLDAIRQISAELHALIATICTNNPPIVVSRPGTVRYLVSEDGQTMISGIEIRERSCIQLTVEAQSNSGEASKAARAVTKSNEKCKATTEEDKVITLVMGDITECTVDVIVNAANDQFIYGDGVAGAILRKGGKIIQEESKLYIQNEGKLFEGDAVMMKKVGNLPCQRLVHAVAPTWKGGDNNEEEFLKSACIESLKLASNYRSIAFPAINAGICGFPATAWAHYMIEAFTSWSKEFGLSPLHDIHVVVNDTAIANAFTEEMQKQLKVLPQFLKSSNTASSSPGNKDTTPSSRRKGRRRHIDSTPSAASPAYNLISKSPSMVSDHQSNLLFLAGKLTIEILCGDITDDASDAVVNPTNDRLRLGGGVGKALLKKAGKELENTLDREISKGYRLEEGKVFYTKSSGALKCKFIYHVVSPDGRKANLLSKTVTACLKKADDQKLASIGFPAIGTAGAYKPAEAAQYICEAIIKYGHSNPHHLQHVRIIIFQPDTYQIFIQTCNDILQSSQPGYNYAVSVFSGSHDAHINESVGFHNTDNRRKDFQPEQSISAPESQTLGNIPDNAILHIQVFARSEYEVQQTEVRLQKVIQNHFKVDCINNDDRVSKLTREQILEFQEKAKNYQVELKLEPHSRRIRFKGDKEDVNELKTDILNVFSKIAVQGGDEKAGKMLQDKVTWKWLDDDEYVAYDHMVNYSIEQAYQEYKINGRKDKFTYSDEEEGNCTINFAKMEEELPDGTIFPIKRSDLKDLLKEAGFPASWEVMPKDSSGKEIACHVVDLHPSDPEYHEVQTAFTSMMPPAGSSGGSTWKNLVKIQRIQNPALYAQYAGRKKIMEKENPQIENEKRLFHGCKGSVVKNIYHQGFYRSFAGVNATLYGEGAYFAVNASYSARPTFSPPDANGNKFMFYARVLTGEYTQGQSGLKVPPPKDPSRSTVILYDSVVDTMNTPNMYVVFTDAQCYPDYLITFT